VPNTTLNCTTMGGAPLWISHREVEEKRTRGKKSRRGEGLRSRAACTAHRRHQRVRRPRTCHLATAVAT
jgi:hypothetical protein